MSVNTSVKEFAAELKVPVDTLLDQLNLAGVPKKSGLDVISEEDKEKLLQTLRNAHAQTADPSSRKKITLTKRTTSEIKQADPSGKSRTIQVEVRKKRVFVKKKSYDENPTEVNADSPQEMSGKSDFEQGKDLGNFESNRQEGIAGGEELAVAYENTYNLPVYITHTMNVFGERQHPEKYIPMCIKKIRDGELVTIHSDKTKKISLYSTIHSVLRNSDNVFAL